MEIFISKRESCVLTSYTHLVNHLRGKEDFTPSQIFLAYSYYFRELHQNENIDAKTLVSFGRKLWNDPSYQEDYNKIERSYTSSYKLSDYKKTVRELLSSVMLHYHCIVCANGISGYEQIKNFNERLSQKDSIVNLKIQIENVDYVDSCFGRGDSVDVNKVVRLLMDQNSSTRAMLALYKVPNVSGSHSIMIYYDGEKFHQIDPNKGYVEDCDLNNLQICEYIIFENKTTRPTYNIDMPMNEAINKVNKNYTLCKDFVLNENKPIYLGNKTERRCRFCGQTKEDGATFRKKAHALSHLIGNRYLLSYYECDECNEKFSHYESDFAEYLKPFHAVLKVCGRGGIPKYKQYLSNIDNEDGILKINIFEEDPTIQLVVNKENKSLELTCRRSYIPINVYKTLLKMALTIMPDEDVVHFNKAIQLLDSKKPVIKGSLSVVEQIFGGGYDVFRYVSAFIFKRKEGVKDNVFAYTFILAYNNFCFQMPLIGCDLDKHLYGQKVEMTVLPTPPLMVGYKLIHNHQIDLSSSEKVSNEDVRIQLRFEEMKEEDLRKESSVEADALIKS